MKQAIITVLAFLFIFTQATPLKAGEPTGKIGTMNPAMFKCVDKSGYEVYQPDPFRKDPGYRFNPAGTDYPLEPIENYLSENPDIREKTCNNDIAFDFGFNPMDSAEFQSYLNNLSRDCDKQGGTLIPITDTRIEGFVYEYHPKDINDPGGEWFPVPSKNVTVMAKGITFEIFWNTNDDGYYYFTGLGAGPIVMSLRLPPEAHPLNPNVVIFSDGLLKTKSAPLGFYRGDAEPGDTEHMRTPQGSILPAPDWNTLETLSLCGYMDLPNIARGIKTEPPPTIGTTPAGMPNVGGVLPPVSSTIITLLAVILVFVLPVGGIFWRYR